MRKRCRSNERFCEHCNQIVAYKTYRAHKRLFYHPSTCSWFVNEAPQEEYMIDDEDLPPASSEESNVEDFDEESPPCSNPACSESETSLSGENTPQQSDQES